MAWTYSDWDQQSTTVARLTRLRLHIQEVADKIQADVSAHGYSRQSSPNNQLYESLVAQKAVLEKRLDGAGNGGMSYARLS